MQELSCYVHKDRLHSMFPPSLGETTSMDTARDRLPVCEACMKKLSRGFLSVREEAEEPGYLVQDSTASMLPAWMSAATRTTERAPVTAEGSAGSTHALQEGCR